MKRGFRRTVEVGAEEATRKFKGTHIFVAGR